ncbi:MAG: FMN-binding negative transcriptional regulator [Trueperaceae bacterium]|nr:FMN-binding negative transcriptional regulator [Trueperaceae bacterium]MCC6310713.1 FMN-binding negative transcriptional regulator [Trueperaceae bacterium]
MYVPPHNREERPEVMHQLIHTHPLGLLVSAGSGGPVANPIPFVLHAEGAAFGTLECHLARANPQWRDLQTATECLVVFQGPQAYVTPSWYPAKREHGKVVPTWNYVIVQARGRPTVTEDRAWLRRHLEELVDHNEEPFDEPWRMTDAPEEYLAAQMKGIVGVSIELTELRGKWKLSQNRSVADQQGTALGLLERGGGHAEVGDMLADRLEAGGCPVRH